MDDRAAAAALRQIGRGFAALADAIDDDQQPAAGRELAVLREWSDRGLTQAEASALFRRHGYAPQTSGGWARGDWIEIRGDGRRYLTERSRSWLAEQNERA